MGIKAYIVGMAGGYYGISYSVSKPVFLPNTDVPQGVAFTSRGDAPNYGSGPYFRATGVIRWKRVGSSDYLKDETKADAYWNRRYAIYHVYELDPTTFIIKGDEYNSDGTYRGPLGGYRNLVISSGDPARPFKVRTDVIRGTGRSPEDYIVQSEGSWFTAAGVDVEYVALPPDPTEYSEEFDMFWRACYGFAHKRDRDAWSAAYLAAAQEVPQADVNLIGNIKEAFDYVKSGISALKDPVSALTSLAKTFTNPKDLWLQYRYVYKTNQMDAKEMEDLVSRLDYLSSVPYEDIRLSATVSSYGARYGANFSLPLSQLLPTDLWDAVKTFGLRVTPSNVWDLIPFSFMADWFLGVGDKLSWFEDWSGALELSPSEIWYTYRSTKPSGTNIYFRVRGSKPVVPPLYESKTASGKVVTMRVADTIAIFT